MKVMICIVMMFLATIVVGQNIPQKPDPMKYVNDFTGRFLTVEETNLLEKKMQACFDSSNIQIVVVIVNDLGGHEKAAYAKKIRDTWNIGIQGGAKGVVLLIKSRMESADESDIRSIFIMPGHTLEKIFTQEVCTRIASEEMKSMIKQGKNFEAINQGTDGIMTEICQPPIKTDDDGMAWALGIIAIVMVVSAIFGFFHWGVSGVIGGVATPLIWTSFLAGGVGTIVLCALSGVCIAIVLHAIFRLIFSGKSGFAEDGLGIIFEVIGNIIGGFFEAIGGGIDF